MPSKILHEQAEHQMKKRPELASGATVRVHERIQEGEKQRIQIFEGLIIGMHGGHNQMDRSFTVRRIASGIGVEKVFPLHSPTIEKIEVKKIANVRRAKLNFLRGRKGKSARLSERFTTDEEFQVAIAPEPIKEEAAAEANASAAKEPEVKKEESKEEAKK